MNTETKTLVNVLRDRMVSMSEDERLELFSDFTEGYCRECGKADGNHYMRCQCWNDE